MNKSEPEKLLFFLMIFTIVSCFDNAQCIDVMFCFFFLVFKKKEKAEQRDDVEGECCADEVDKCETVYSFYF